MVAHYRWHPLLPQQVTVLRSGIYLVVGIFCTILQLPLLRKDSLTSHRGCRHAEECLGAVVVERVNIATASIYSCAVRVSIQTIAAVVVGKYLKHRAQRVGLEDVVKCGVVSCAVAVAVIDTIAQPSIGWCIEAG